MNLPHEAEPLLGSEPSSGDLRAPRRLGDLQKTITMAQIAKAAGVSQGAISSLLNDRDYGIRVSERTRERVFKVCREMGYLPNDLRAVVRMYPELGDFGLLISARYQGGIAHPMVARIAAAAMRAVPGPHHSLTIACYDEDTDYQLAPEELPQPVASGVVSKFILVGAPNVSLIQTLTRRGWPTVILGYDHPAMGVLSILPDFAQAGQLAIEHLCKLGHKEIGIISGPFGATDLEMVELHRGVQRACEQCDLPVEGQKIIYGELTTPAGANAFETLLARSPGATAAFCLTDTVAAGFLAEAHRRGRTVPEQFSVIGCSDDAMAALLHPALTSVHLPLEEVATLAVEQIDQLFLEGTLPEPRKIVLPVKLIERASCGPHRSELSLDAPRLSAPKNAA